MEQKYKYDGFISYRHITPDKELVIALQKMLENYKPPRSVAPRGTRLRIFRDETDLPTSNDLSEGIRDALEHSRYLIFVCSKTTGQSRWCMEELQRFKSLHNGSNSNIVTLIVDGDPSEVFPAELYTQLVPVEDGAGGIVYECRIVEPLAANVAAPTIKKAKKKLKTEFFRIAAPLLGCSYDALYKREQRRKTRRTAAIVGIVTAALLAFGLYTGAMLLRISQQKAELEVANTQLQETNHALEEKTREAEENAAEARRQTLLQQIENAKNLCALSESQWAGGEGLTAIRTALSALPTEADPKPEVAEAKRVLAREIGAFSRKSFAPTLTLSHGTAVTSVGYAGDGSTVVTQDENGIYLWSSTDGTLKKSFTAADFGTTLPTLVLENRGTVERSSAVKTNGSTIHVQNNAFMGYEKSGEERSVSPDDLFLFGGKNACKVDGKSGEILWTTPDADSGTRYYLTDTALVRNMKDYTSGLTLITRFDRMSGAELSTYSLSPEHMGDAYTYEWLCVSDATVIGYDGGHLVAWEVKNDALVNPRTLFLPEGGKYNGAILGCRETDSAWIFLCAADRALVYYDLEIRVYEKDSTKLKWACTVQEVEMGSVADVDVFRQENTGNYCDVLYVAYGNTAALFEAETGTPLKEYRLDGGVSTVYHSENGFLYILTTDGLEQLIFAAGLSAEADTAERLRYTIHQFPGEFSLSAYFGHSYAVCKASSHDVHIYADVPNSDFSSLFENASNSSQSKVFANSSGSHVIIDAYTALYVYDTESGTLRKQVAYEGYGMNTALMDDQTLAVIYKNTLTLYDLHSGDTLYSAQLSFSPSSYAELVPVNGQLALVNGSSLMLLSAEGERAAWNPAVTEEGYQRTGSIQKLWPSPNGTLLLAQVTYYGQTGTRLEVYDPETEAHCVLDKALKTESGDVKVVAAAWVSGDEVAAAFDDGTLCRFSAGDGSLLGSISLTELPQLVSLIPAWTDGSMGLLCNDSLLYRLDLTTGSILGSTDLDNDSIRSATTDRTKWQMADGILFLAGWSKDSRTLAYAMDAATLEVIYEIPAFAAYMPSHGLVLVNDYSHVGAYPLYTTQALTAKAEAFLGS